MPIIVVGVNHTTASTPLREKVSFSQNQLSAALKALLASSDNLNEAVILSTCNRTEIYAVARSAHQGIEDLIRFIEGYQQLQGPDLVEFREAVYTRQSRAAVGKLFRVVCSLDSLVLGEAQILGQTKRAYEAARECKAAGEVFNHLFKQSIELGKRVRTETRIGANSISVSTVAVQLAQRVMGDLKGRKVLIIGAGEMAELTLMYLRGCGTAKLFIANRTKEYARDLADRAGADEVFTLDELEEALELSDIVIASAYSPDGYLLTKDLVARACAKRANRPLLIVDIALPRNVEDACADVDEVYCYSLDDLGSIIDQHKEERELEAAKVRDMIRDELDAFHLWMQQRAVVPTIKEIYSKGERICEREVAKAIKELRKLKGDVSQDEENVMRALANAIMKKQLHGPVIRLRKQSDDPAAYIHTESARYLFGLDTNPLGLPCGQRHDHCALKAGHGCSAAESDQCPFGNRIEDGVKSND